MDMIDWQLGSPYQQYPPFPGNLQQNNYNQLQALQQNYVGPAPTLDGQVLSTQEEKIIRKFREKKQKKEDYELSRMMAI